METDLFSVSIAFSTGITCMPMPAPPGGTIGVTFSSGRNVMRSKNAATSGCSSICDWRMLTNSALPGTNCGSVQRFSWFGFFPSRFSQLYSTRPMYAISVSSFSSSSSLLPVSAAIERDIRHFVRNNARESPILGIVARDLADAVGDHRAELEDLLSRLVRAGDRKGIFAFIHRHSGLSLLIHADSSTFYISFV